MQVGICDWLNVIDAEWPAPRCAMDVQVRKAMPSSQCHGSLCHVPKLDISSLGGGVFALAAMVDHMSFRRDFLGTFEGLNPRMAGLEDGESLFTHLKTKTMRAEQYSARHFLSIQQALGEGESDNVYWAPGTENPAGGLTKVRSDMVPLLRLLQSGHFYPASLRPLRGVAWAEEEGRGKYGNWLFACAQMGYGRSVG